jgi:hypothetical protein
MKFTGIKVLGGSVAGLLICSLAQAFPADFEENGIIHYGDVRITSSTRFPCGTSFKGQVTVDDGRTLVAGGFEKHCGWTGGETIERYYIILPDGQNIPLRF